MNVWTHVKFLSSHLSVGSSPHLQVALPTDKTAEALANVLQTTISGSMSSDKWPRSAIAFLSKERSDDLEDQCLATLATCAIALLVFASDFKNITNEILSKDRSPRNLFDGRRSGDIAREAIGYAGFLKHFFKKTALRAATPSATASSSLAINTLWAVTTCMAGPVELASALKEANRNSLFSTMLSINIGCFTSCRMGRLAHDYGVPKPFATLLTYIASSKVAFQLFSQTRQNAYMSGYMEEKTDQLIRFMASRQYKTPLALGDVASRHFFADRALLSVLTSARMRTPRAHYTSRNLETAAGILGDSSPPSSSSDSENEVSTRKRTAVTDPPKSPPRKVVMTEKTTQPAACPERIRLPARGPRMCHNCTNIPEPLPCKGSWRDRRDGARVFCANAGP